MYTTQQKLVKLKLQLNKVDLISQWQFWAEFFYLIFFFERFKIGHLEDLVQEYKSFLPYFADRDFERQIGFRQCFFIKNVLKKFYHEARLFIA